MTRERTPQSWAERIPATRGLDGVWRAGRPPRSARLDVEADVQADILSALSPALLIDERKAGLVTVEGRSFHAATPGAADLYGCLPGGRHLECELKHPGKAPRYQPGQLAWLARCAKLGAVAIIARDVLDVLEALAGEGYLVEARPAPGHPCGLVVVGLHPPPRRGLRDHRQRCREALGRVSALRSAGTP